VWRGRVEVATRQLEIGQGFREARGLVAVGAGGFVLQLLTLRALLGAGLPVPGATALAVGVALVIGVLRILTAWPIHLMIAGGYLLVIVLTTLAPPEIVGIAYDSGGVTTSTLTVPLVAALGIGLASSIEGRNPVLDGFGLIAFASLTPIVFVLCYGMMI